ncbi:MAG TPA: hypothetical protein VGB85_33315 [Nannocystis sp.]
MPTEDWIQESLARLESLEEERNRHEAALETSTDPAALRMNAQAIERLDAKIRSLYAELEAAAEQGDAEQGDAVDTDLGDDPDLGDEAEGEDDVAGGTTQMFRRDDLAAQAAAMRTSPETVRSVPASPKIGPAAAAAPAAAARVTPVAAAAVAAATAPTASPFSAPVSTPAPVSSAPAASPFGGAAAASAPTASPFGNSASPFGEVPQAAPFGNSGDSAGFSAPATSNSSFDAGNSFDDESSSGSGSKMGIIIGVVVVVLGLGAYLAFGGKGDEPPPAAPAGPVKVIGGLEVPPDTQGPKTVQGSSDAIKGTQYKEGRPQSGGGGGGSNAPRPSDKPVKKDPRAKIQNADDPLAGIDK